MIPVTIHLPPEIFNRLEKIAANRNMTMRDLIVTGLTPKPATRITGNIRSPRANGYTHLTEEQWDEIRRLHAAKWTVPQLAVRFGCSSSAIYKHLQKRKDNAA